MNPALMIVHRGTDGMVVPMPFTYKNGEMSPIVKDVAEYIAGMELKDSLWEGVAADRLATILENRMRLVALGEIIDRQKAIIDYAREHGGPLSEAMK